MTTKLKHTKRNPFTDKDIEQYCQSVEKLLVTINDRKIAKKSKKTRERKEISFSSNEDDWPLSRN